MRRAVALLALAVLLAGCTGGGGGAVPATPTVTPAPVPGDPVGPTGELSPGIRPDTVDVSRLAWAHARAANAHAYRFVLWENRTVRIDGEVAWQRANRTTGVVAADGTYLLARSSYLTANGTTTGVVLVERYSDGATEFQRFSGSVVRYLPNRNRVDEATVFPVIIYGGTNTTLADDYVRDGRAYTRVFGYGGANPAISNASNYQVRALVRSGGLIEEFEARYTDRSSPRTEFVTVSVRYDAVDAVATVPPPEWYAPD